MEKPTEISNRLAATAFCIAGWLAGGYAYGLFVAWKMDLQDRAQDTILVMLYTSLAFGLLGLTLLLFRLVARSLVRLIDKRKSYSNIHLSAAFLGGLGGFSFAWSILFALGDTIVAVGFQPSSSMFWLVVRIIISLSVGILMLWLMTRPLRKLAISNISHPFYARLSVLVPSVLAILTIIALGMGLGTKTTASRSKSIRVSEEKIEVSDTGLRVVLMGLDGATWKVLNPLMKAGTMPVMAKLVTQGAIATPLSPPPRASPITWTTIVTGRPKEEHGIEEYLLVSIPGLSPFPFESLAHNRSILPFSFTVLGYFAAGLAQGIPPTSDRVKTKTVWQMLSMAGKKSLVLGLPCTWPARPIAGMILSDRFGPNEFDMFSSHKGPVPDRVYPPEEERNLADLVVDSKENPATMLKVIAGFDAKSSSELASWHYNPVITSPMKLLTNVYDADMTFMNVLKNRFPEGDYSFAAILLNGLDLVMHAFWKFRFPKDFGLERSKNPRWGKLIDAYHGLLDRRIGDFMKSISPQTVVLFVSDSGMLASPHNPVWPGWHSADAMFLAVGQPIVAQAHLDNMQYADVVPTILYLLGLPVPKDLKGRVLVEMIKPDFLTAHPIKYIDSYER